jgi:butyryl-CoA dehydrogenase
MTALTLNPRDVDFLLYELLKVEELTERPPFTDHSRETFEAAIETARKIAEERFLPLYRETDLHEPRIVEGRVEMIPPVKEALDAAAEAGFIAAHKPFEQGGMQLPWTVAQAALAHFKAANIGIFAYHFLTIAAANMIDAFGAEAQKARYLEAMLAGQFYGTMVLTEPQAGSSLADIKTSAEPTAAGHYLLKGSKIFISCGAHELSENIIHLVLARIKGAPVGVKGISLFIVPRYRMEGDGRADNDITLTGLIHKMGYRGTTSTILQFGDKGDCRGELLGEPHMGLSYMFRMMNEARIGVGLGAACLGYVGYLNSLDYARNRPQGRKPDAKDPSRPPIAIVEHADVKRMLLAQKAYAEGALALCLFAARLIDEQRTAPEAEARRKAGLLLELLTPIVKAWPSDYGPEANRLAIQVLGGYGYTRDYPVEQHYRDNRLNAIHEGTNGIQAIDLLGRKVAMADGEALTLFAQEITRSAAAAKAQDGLGDYANELTQALAMIRETTDALLAARQRGAVELSLANASLYLDALGHLTVAWLWLRQALAARAGEAGAGPEDADFYRGKLQACRYFFRFELPKIEQHCRLLGALDGTTMEMQDAWF